MLYTGLIEVREQQLLVKRRQKETASLLPHEEESEEKGTSPFCITYNIEGPEPSHDHL